MRVGLQITKNKDTYKKLLSLIKPLEFKEVEFCYIENESLIDIAPSVVFIIRSTSPFFIISTI